MTILRNPARRPARRRGVTLIEAVLFISIALGLIVGGIVFFQQASTAQRVNDAVRTISGITSETRALYQSATSFGGLTETVLIGAGAVPSSIVVDVGNDGDITNDTLQNEWGGAINLGPTQDAENANFHVTYVGLPQAACVRLAQFGQDGTGPIGSGIVAVHIDEDGTTAFPDGVAVDGGAEHTAAAGGLTPADTAAECLDDSDVTWVLTR